MLARLRLGTTLRPRCSSLCGVKNLRFFASEGDTTSNNSSAAGDDGSDRPQMYHLQHIQKRLEYTVPFMFRGRMDWTFYHPQVVCTDHIFNLEKRGLHDLMYHIGMISVLGQWCFPYIRMEALSITPILEDGSVRLRWRVPYLTWMQALNWKNFNAEYREKNAKWFDGYSIFYADGNGFVTKVTIQKMMPDDSFMQQQTKKLGEKIGALNSGAPAANFVPVKRQDDHHDDPKQGK
uniref:Uncharacterized protein n=1 Tax=Panagrellus redivivus TaxID=6233 RepID=A0A7E4UR90_PANRE